MADIVIPDRTENIYSVKPAVSTKNLFKKASIPQNPGLAENNFNGGHQDSYCSESVGLNGPTGNRLKAIVQLNPYGFSPIMAANKSGQLISMAFDLPGVFTLITFDEDCKITSATPAGTHVVKKGILTFNGGYFFLDKDENSILTIENRLKCFPTANVPEKSEVYKLEPLWLSENVVELVTGDSKNNNLYSALPVWDAPKNQPYLYWCLIGGEYDTDTATLISHAYMAVVLVDPSAHRRFPGRYAVTKVLAKHPIHDGWNNNTFAVTEKGAFFVTNNIDPITKACDKGYLWAVAYEPPTSGEQVGKIVVRWKHSYENSGILKVGQKNIGSGTTPTVSVTTDGKTLVSITDNAYPRVNTVTVNDKDGSLVCKVPVFPEMRGCDEASLIGVQDHLIVENNFGHTVSATQSQLVANEPGMALIKVPAFKICSSTIVWEKDAPTSTFFGMSMLARKSGIIFAFTGDWGDSVSATKGGEYFITAMDSWDGRVIWRIPVGRGKFYTHEYGGMYFNRSGDKIYVGTNRFLVSIQDAGTSED